MESINEIRVLLEKYYDGSSSRAEEARLTRYFRNEEVPEDLLPEKEMFSFFDDCEENEEMPVGFDLRMAGVFDRLEKKENRTRRLSIFSLSGLAAGLMIILAVYLVYLKNDRTEELASANYMDTYSDPNQAYEETLKALNYISTRFNDGTKELKSLGQMSQSVQHIQPLSLINKGQKELSILGKFDSGSRSKRQ